MTSIAFIGLGNMGTHGQEPKAASQPAYFDLSESALGDVAEAGGQIVASAPAACEEPRW